ncbi:hypothetical protein AKO1_014808 [Acrasis kona]|uniref:Pseudouridine synthase RsuA/RluA-like domain-containing protein n=1 Tax=Acrasis kona TaxID=1008807 RepID=A0AAW2Z068_9EUKA
MNSFTVTGDYSKMRLDAFLHKNSAFSHLSKSQIAKTIEQQKLPPDDNALFVVQINGERVVKPLHKLKVGDVITYSIKVDTEPKKILSELVAQEDIPVDILYVDEHIIVVNKPKNMVVHPSSNRNLSGTLINALLFKFGADGLYDPPEEKESESANDKHYRPGIVHRLDKDTSGVMVVARTAQAYDGLKKQFMLKDKLSMKRTYSALVEGDMNTKAIMQIRGGSAHESQDVKRDANVITVYIGRHPKEPSKRVAHWENKQSNLKQAVTRFTPIEEFTNSKYDVKFTLVDLTLETGRTHQIRVSMGLINRPLVGDEMYNPRYNVKKGRKKEDELTLDTRRAGQFLHARLLGFIHPHTNTYVEYQAPIPEYFENFMKQIRNN